MEEFHDMDQAVKAYGEREEQYRDNPRVEVVFLGADSIEAIKVTHSNYFEETADAFSGLAAQIGFLEEWQKSEAARLMADGYRAHSLANPAPRAGAS